MCKTIILDIKKDMAKVKENPELLLDTLEDLLCKIELILQKHRQDIYCLYDDDSFHQSFGIHNERDAKS